MATDRPRILVIEDDATLALGLELNLSAEGYAVTLARNGPAGLRLALAGDVDLVVLDLMLPGLDGFDLLARLRDQGRRLPVIILSARGQLDDKIRGLGLGADDYMTKPFAARELAARIHAALRRAAPAAARRQIRFAAVEVDLEARRVQRDGVEVVLTSREFDLLAWLLERPGRLQTRSGLLDAVWGWDYDGTERTVDNFFRRLRVKLEVDPANPAHLITVRGAGYRFDP